MTESVYTLQTEVWPIDWFVFYARNPRKGNSTTQTSISALPGAAVAGLAACGGLPNTGRLQAVGLA
jgi:hypothetical protein